ncbi:MAG TPA: thiolase family protein [Acidimicrobiales bacterium]|nr:thiolase family protein [Acidimicrobiales bacterium]
MNPLSRVAVVGVGTTEMARRLPTTTLAACLDAARAALDDAGLQVADVDGVAARWPGPGGTVFHPGSADWANLLGIPLRWIGDTYPQGVPAALDAAAAIACGQADVVLVVGGQAGVLGGGSVAAYTRPDNEFVACWGSITQAQFALVAQVYLHRYRPDRTRLAAVAAAVRNAGSANPTAVMAGRGPYRAEDVLASPVVATPFHRLEVCLASEGAAAMVLTSADRAGGCRQPPVRLLGGACEWYRQQYVDPPRFDDVGRIGADAGRRTFGMAGLAPADVDVLELYDVNVFEIVRQLEALGFCGPGEGTDLVAERGIGPGDGLPLNTDGGLLSHSHIGWGAPTVKIVEAVRQLRGTAPSGQVPGASVALVTGAGAGAQYQNVLLLGTG